jgi:peptidyl-prolyl cis-trans isomerase SurA
MKHLFIAILLLGLTQTHAKLLDKTVAIFNSTVITLSQVQRIQDNIASRRNISPIIYKDTNLTQKQIVDLMIERLIIREKLNEIGYVRNDEQVETEIQSIEKRLGLNREQLLSFLESNNMSFDEYFEVIRETIEFNIFNGRIVRPLISVTDQEIKNHFYKQSKDKTLAFKYTLVDFSMNESKMKKGMLSKFSSVLEKFQVTGILPKNYESVETNVLGDITEDGLTDNLKKTLKATDEGQFSSPVKLGDTFHVFFVKKKDLVESDLFLQVKDQIRGELMSKQAVGVTELWFKREISKHYIRKYIK